MNATDLMIEIQILKECIHELERQSTAVMCSQADVITQGHTSIRDGPSSLDCIRSFSLDSVICDIKTQAPDLYQFFMTMGDVQRNAKEGDIRK